MKNEEYQSNLDCNFIDNAFEMLGIRFKACDLCGCTMKGIERVCAGCRETEEQELKIWLERENAK